MRYVLGAVIAVILTAFGLIGTQPTASEAASPPVLVDAEIELAEPTGQPDWYSFTGVCGVLWTSPSGEVGPPMLFDGPQTVMVRSHDGWDKLKFAEDARSIPIDPEGVLQFWNCPS